MFGLDYRKYKIIHLETEKITPWIVNPDSIRSIKELAAFIKNISMHMEKRYPYDTYKYLTSKYLAPKKTIKNITLEDVLGIIGLKTKQWPSDTFFNHYDFNNFKSNTKCLLFTEKNLIPQHIGMGSSRHVLGVNYQLKGIGKNSLAHDEDYYHSWGGMVCRDGLAVILSDHAIEKRTKLGCMKTDAVFRYAKEQLKNTPLVLSLRKNNTFRLSQIVDHFISHDEKKFVRKHLFSIFKTEGAHNIFAKIVENYVHAASVGVFHRSVTQENLTIDGRFIDTESIDYTKDSKAIPFYISVGLKKDTHSYGPKIKLVSDKALRNNEIFFYGSWIHDLLLISEMTSKSFKAIFNEDFEYEDLTLRFIEDYFPGKLEKWKALLQYTSFGKYMSLTGELKVDCINNIGEVISLCGEYYCTGSHYDLWTHLDKVTFSQQEDDLSLYRLKMLRKVEAALWSKELSWDQSFENWKITNP